MLVGALYCKSCVVRGGPCSLFVSQDSEKSDDSGPPHAIQTPPMQLRADLAVSVSGQESIPSLVFIGKYNRSWSRGVEIRPPPCGADPPHAKPEDFL